MNALIASYTCMRAVLSTRMDRLSEARSARDRGASAVELAIITAVILVIAGIILTAIHTFVQNKSDEINGGG